MRIYFSDHILYVYEMIQVLNRQVNELFDTHNQLYTIVIFF